MNNCLPIILQRKVSMKSRSISRKVSQCMLLAAFFLTAPQRAAAQAPPPAWAFTQFFRYNIENIVVNATTPGTWNVKVIFSVTNPTTPTNEALDIWSAAPFQSRGATFTMDVGWDPSTDFTNTGSVNSPPFPPVVTTSLGTGSAYPIQLRNLNNIPGLPPGPAQRCLDSAQCPGIANLTNRFWISRAVSPVMFMRAVVNGRVGLEGHPVCNGLAGCPAGPPFANIPVKSEVANFSFLATATPTSAVIADPRRPIVDFDTKCIACHNGSTLSGAGTLIPRLNLHGSNRNENLRLCVICHNPNQTDVPFRLLTSDPRTSGPETSVDFKRMIHSIHAGEFRDNPFVVIGFNSSIHDFSGVRFPKKLRDCLNCHVEIGGRGTFELPLPSTVLGTTVNTGSVYAVPLGATRTIDLNPFNDLKITPIAAACSGCHDDSETRSHMVSTGGASFATLQQNIGVTVIERCVVCHGPGKDKDVRKVHLGDDDEEEEE